MSRYILENKILTFDSSVDPKNVLITVPGVNDITNFPYAMLHRFELSVSDHDPFTLYFPLVEIEGEGDLAFSFSVNPVQKIVFATGETWLPPLNGNVFVQNDNIGVTITISGTDNDNILTIAGESGPFNSAYGYAGDDTVSIGGEKIFVSAGMGNDSVTVRSARAGEVYTDAGDDTIAFLSGSSLIVDAGEGNDMINGQGVEASTIHAGAGDDNIDLNLYGSSSITIFGDEGNDRFNIISTIGRSRFDGGAGNDTMIFYGLTSADVSGGSGNNTITVEEPSDGLTIISGDGDDRIAFGRVFDGSVDSGAGNDVIQTTSIDAFTINGGEGNDEIKVTEKASSSVIAGGLGADTLRLAVGNMGYTWIFADAPTAPIQPQDALALLNTTPFIEIEASANLYEGVPLLNILVDGKTVASQVAITADFTKGERQTLRFTDPAFLGAGEISLRFLNDLWGGSRDTDRNVHIHQVKLPGRTLVNADAVYMVGGRALSALQADGRNMLWTNGTLTFNAQPKETGPVANELRIVASGDVFEGNPVLRVAVDGVIIGDYEVSALRKNGQTQEFRLTVGNLLNSGNLDLRMMNDKWGGSKDKDRNLLISEVTLNGTRLDNRTATYDNRTGVTLNRQGEHFLFGGGTLRYGLAPYASVMHSPAAYPVGDSVTISGELGQDAVTNFQITLDPVTGQPTGQFESFDTGSIITGGETADVFRLDHDTGGLVRGFEAGKDRIEIDTAYKSSLQLIEMMNATLLSFERNDSGSSATISGYAIEGINAEQVAASLSFVTVG